MFVKKLIVVLVVLIAFGAAGHDSPPVSHGSGGEVRYVVKPGDTLWEIAASRYDGDPREAIWRIKSRNGLGDSSLTPGMVLALPR